MKIRPVHEQFVAKDDSIGGKGYISEALAMEECIICNLCYNFRNFDGKHSCVTIQHARGNHSDEGRDSEVGEDAAIECSSSNTFNAIVETNRTSKRACEGSITNPPE
jgi:hypothetical protein